MLICTRINFGKNYNRCHLLIMPCLVQRRPALLARLSWSEFKQEHFMDTLPLTGNVPPSAPPKGNDKIWTVLSHLSFFLGVPFLLPLVVYLVMRQESEYVAENAREALNFHISVLIYSICCIPLLFILIGYPLLVVLVISSLILAVKAAVKASNGLCYRYPLTLRLV